MTSRRRTPRRNSERGVGAMGGGAQDTIRDEAKSCEVPAMEEHWVDHMGSPGGRRAPLLCTLRER